MVLVGPFQVETTFLVVIWERLVKSINSLLNVSIFNCIIFNNNYCSVELLFNTIMWKYTNPLNFTSLCNLKLTAVINNNYIMKWWNWWKYIWESETDITVNNLNCWFCLAYPMYARLYIIHEPKCGLLSHLIRFLTPVI